jgi:hypothetical protein
MPWHARRNASFKHPRRNVASKRWRPHPNRASGRRLRFPFWAGWVALIAGSAVFYFATNPALWPSMGQASPYRCRMNLYDCSDFRTRIAAQAAYQACGGPRSDVHGLDDDRDGLACERLPWITWFGGH